VDEGRTVELVLLGAGTIERRAFDRQDDGTVVTREKNVTTEAVCSVLPAEGKALNRK
jgi:hypothetical protein